MAQSQKISQSWYYNTPYPPILIPSIQYSQTTSPSSSQFTSESNSPIPSPTQYSPLQCQEASLSENFIAPDHSGGCQCATFQNQPFTPHPHPTPYNFPVLNDSAPRLSKPRAEKSSAPCSKKFQIAHPYARIFAKKDEVKRRKIWNHALEKSIFNPYELWVHVSLLIYLLLANEIVSFLLDQRSLHLSGAPFISQA